MWRSFFLASGVYCCLLGAQSLSVDRAMLSSKDPAPARFMNMSFGGGSGMVRNNEITPPAWAPWSLLSLGAVTLLYSFTIPKRAAGG